jgi:hypothetical protein
MEQADIDRIVTETSQLTAELYVFPDIGERLGELLRDRVSAGRYAGVGTPSMLADLVTGDLQSLNDDQHLRLKHHDNEIPDLPGSEMLLSIFSAQAARSMGGIARVERLDGNVAHLELRPMLFPPSLAGDAITGAMRLVAQADALILDLRQTVGGDPTAVALLCSYLFDEPVHLNDIYERESDRIVQSWTLPYVPGARFGATKPVYVLTSSATFSGGEELAYDLQQQGRAVIVGERTRGGAHPRTGRRLHPHLEVTIPTGRAINPVTGTNWEGVGVQPDIDVPATHALRRAHELACAPPAQIPGQGNQPAAVPGASDSGSPG